MIGKVKIHEKLVIDKVLYLPGFNVNLISVSRLSKDHNCMIMFEDDSCIIQERGTIRKIGLAKQLDGLYYLKSIQVKLSASVNAIDIDPSRLWHLRLGNLSHDRTKVLKKKYSYIPNLAKASCDVCHMKKINMKPYALSNFNVKHIFDMIHVDIWGPLSKTSIHGFRYFLTILDYHSMYLYVILIKTKGEVHNCLKGLINMVKTQFEKNVKTIRSDNGLAVLLKYFF